MIMKKTILLFLFVTVTTVVTYSQTVTDADGNIYDTVHIGNQVWLQENLATTKYNDGTAIPTTKDSITWFKLTTPGYCWYRNDSVKYKALYGALYNWYSVSTGKICPTHWHVPSNSEWHILMVNLDSNAIDQYGIESLTAGDKLKETGTSHWGKGNTATNSSGFTAMPAGFRNSFDKNFEGSTSVSYFWTSTSIPGTSRAWERWFANNNANIEEFKDLLTPALSIRCLRDSDITDNNAVIDTIKTGIKIYKKENKCKLYPNPAKENIFIESNDNSAILKMYTSTGELVMIKSLQFGINEIAISELIQGTYFVKVIEKDAVSVQKIVKQL